MKIMFLQLWYDMYGGAETVNHCLAEQFKKDGYKVKIQCLYNCKKNEIIDEITYDKQFISYELKRPSYKEMLKKLLNLKTREFCSDVIECFWEKSNKIKTYYKLRKQINNYNPDWIIVTNPEIINKVPKKFLKKCLMHLHSGCEEYIKSKKLSKILYRYHKKINKLIWLTEGFMKEGEKNGLTNGTYMYNPVRIRSSKRSSLKNNNIIYVGRIAEPKRVYLLTDIFNCFNKNEKKWNLNIYGSGVDDKMILNENIHLCGSTNNVKEKLLESDIFALTSSTEGFPMVVLEAYECGVPVITFDFKISCNEVVKDGETGFVIEMDNKEEYIKKLKYLCHNTELRERMGKNAKEYVKQFYPEIISQRWYKLFKGEL